MFAASLTVTNSSNASTATNNSTAKQTQTQTGKQRAQNWNQDAAKNNTKDWSDWNPLAISSMADDIKEALAEINTTASKTNATQQPTATPTTATGVDHTTLQQAQQQYGKMVGTLAYWLYHNQNTALGKAILNGMDDFEKLTSSAVYQDLINGIYTAADFGTSMLPISGAGKGLLEFRGYNPVTGEPVSRLGATVDTIFGLADLGGFAKLAERVGMFANKNVDIVSGEKSLFKSSLSDTPFENISTIPKEKFDL